MDKISVQTPHIFIASGELACRHLVGSRGTDSGFFSAAKEELHAAALARIPPEETSLNNNSEDREAIGLGDKRTV